MKISNLYKKYYPEIYGIKTMIISSLLCSYSGVEISNKTLESISQLLSQVLAAYLGLLLTTFGVLYGLNLKSEYLKRAISQNLPNEKIELIANSFRSIYNGFLFSISTIAIGTLVTFIIYSGTIVSKDNASFSNFLFGSTLNSVLLGIMLGFTITGTINIISTVRTILELSD